MKAIIERMTEEEYKHLSIDYAFYDTPIKKILVASTGKGVCYLGFADGHEGALELLADRFPHATLQAGKTRIQQDALRGFNPGETEGLVLRFHLYGTDFQLDVWKALLEIPFGQRMSYGWVAEKINRPKACRAVGTAVGSNPVAYLIPCHRVILADGGTGNYYWGGEFKKRILEWEFLVSR